MVPPGDRGERARDRIRRPGRGACAARDGSVDSLRADAYALCLGSHGLRPPAPLGLRLPIYPVGATDHRTGTQEPALAPHVSLTDESRRIVCSRLGDRLRVAGTAELDGFDTTIRAARIAPIMARVQARFPHAIDLERAGTWAGCPARGETCH